jgi:hypothetical protein
LWIQEEFGCHLQEGILLCKSGMAKKENWDPRKVWTVQGVRHCQNKEDPLCKSGKAQGT